MAFLNSIPTPEMGNRWLEIVLVQTGIKTDPSKMTDSRQRPTSEISAETNAGAKYFFGIPIQVMQGKPKEVFTQVFNNAFPAGTISVDDAVKQMNAAFDAKQVR